MALRIARDIISELSIKLNSIRVPLIEQTDIYFGNQGVVKNTIISESTLKKKHNSINYHVIPKVVAAGILHVGKEDTDTNLANLLKKLMAYLRKNELLGHILYDY